MICPTDNADISVNHEMTVRVVEWLARRGEMFRTGAHKQFSLSLAITEKISFSSSFAITCPSRPTWRGAVRYLFH